MPNGHTGQRNGASGAPADHFAHSRRRIENNEMTLDTIAGSLLRIFVRNGTILARRAADPSVAVSGANGYLSGQRRRASGRSSGSRGGRCFGRRSSLCGERCFGRRSGLPRAALTALLSFLISSPHSSTDRSGL